MFADQVRAVGIKRSVKDRLGDIHFSPISDRDRQESLKRQRQDATKRDHIVSGEKSQEKILVKRVVRESLTSDMMNKDLSRTVKGASLCSARDMPDRTVYMSKSTGPVVVSDIKAESKNRAANAGLAGISVVKAIPLSKPKDDCSLLVSGIKAIPGVDLTSSKKPVIQSKSALNVTKEKKKHLAEDLDVPSFLQSLGLSKYVITFKVEEIDMFALRHMNEGDLKEIGLPMGPRKKIVTGLASAGTTNK